VFEEGHLGLQSAALKFLIVSLLLGSPATLIVSPAKVRHSASSVIGTYPAGHLPVFDLNLGRVTRQVSIVLQHVFPCASFVPRQKWGSEGARGAVTSCKPSQHGSGRLDRSSPLSEHVLTQELLSAVLWHDNPKPTRQDGKAFPVLPSIPSQGSPSIAPLVSNKQE